MVGRSKFFVAALGAVAAMSLMSGAAEAATSYAGQGTGGGSAVQNWISAVNGHYVANVVVTPGSGTGGFNANNYVLPLKQDTGMKMGLSSVGGTMPATGSMGGLLNP